jgi:hypothetical protein
VISNAMFPWPTRWAQKIFGAITQNHVFCPAALSAAKKVAA